MQITTGRNRNNKGMYCMKRNFFKGGALSVDKLIVERVPPVQFKCSDILDISIKKSIQFAV